MKDPIKRKEKAVKFDELEEDSWVYDVPTFEPNGKSRKILYHEIAPPVHDFRPVDRGLNSGETTVSLLVSSGISAIAAVTLFVFGASLFRSFLVYLLGSVCLFIAIRFLLFFIRRSDG